MSTIYTIRRVLCTRNDWSLARVDYQGEELVVGGKWPCKLIPGQRFRGQCKINARGRSLVHIAHVNADENAFRGMLHTAEVYSKQADALFKNGMKKLRRALESGDPRAFKRWAGVGKATANKALEVYVKFKQSFSFRMPWYERFPTLEEKFIPAFDEIMRVQNPDDWSEPYETLCKTRKFWGFEEDDLATSMKFARIIAHDSGIDDTNEWYQRFQRAVQTHGSLNSTGSTWMNASETQLAPLMSDPYVADNNVCTLKKYVNAEKTIAEVIAKLFRRHMKKRVHERDELFDDVSPTDDLDDVQSQAVTMATTQPVSILCGGAGVGKSRTLAHIVKEMGDIGVLVCAPTGKAASRLIDMGIEARTLHSAIFMGKTDMGAQILKSCHHLVLDEQSMQDVVVLAALLRRLPNLESILFVGDPFQLPSVGPGALLRDLLACKQIPTTRLTKIYRQEGGSIVLNANRVRRGNVNLTQDASFRVHDYNVDAVIGQFIRLWDEENPPVILTALNQTVATLNKAIHQRLRHGCIPVHGVSFYGYGKPWPVYVGDRMMNIKNTRVVTDEANFYVANGSIGVVTAATEKTIHVQFGEDILVVDEPSKQLRPCYAITVHKSQGSEYDHVLCVVEPSRIMDRTLTYTAITRAKQTCTVYETSHALQRAIGTRQKPRRTRLQEYINTCCSQTTNTSPPSSPQPIVSNVTPAAPRLEFLNMKRRSSEQLGPSTAKRRLFSSTHDES